jgi:hypothetical protein
MCDMHAWVEQGWHRLLILTVDERSGRKTYLKHAREYLEFASNCRREPQEGREAALNLPLGGLCNRGLQSAVPEDHS